MGKEPKFRIVPVDKTGKATDFNQATYLLAIETGMSAVIGVITPYQGAVLSKTKKVLHTTTGANYSRVRGQLESWVEQQNAS